MQMKIHIFLTFFILAFGQKILAGEPSANSCDYYFDVEEEYQCGSKRYPLNFGYRLCERYLKAESQVSKEVQEWFPKIRLCLQQFIQDEKGTMEGCRDLKKKSIDSHIPCYIETGFCSLDFKDVLKIMQITSKDLLNPDILGMSIRVWQQCSHGDS